MAVLTMRAYGRTVSLAGPDDAVQAAGALLPPTYRRNDDAVPEQQWTVDRDDGGRWAARAGDRPLGAWSDPTVAAEAALSDLELWVAEHARTGVFVHAGCVAFGPTAVVIPGRSMTGKTSLTVALVRAGGTYYSDEYAVLDRLGRVRPYARPLAVRGGAAGPGRRVDVAEIGGRAGRWPARVAVVAALRWDGDAGWDAEELSPASAVLRLMDNAVAGRNRPRAVLDALAAAAAGARTIGGTRGEADDAAGRILHLVEAAGGRVPV